MYVCGPTVYGDIHIGNCRPVIVFDVLYRLLTYIGYKVTYMSNITDVDDKIINRAIEENITEAQVAEKYLNLFSEKSGIEKRSIQRWIPIVAATQMTKNISEEQEMLSKWINVVDYE